MVAKLEQRTEAWEAARRGRLTASNVGAVLGNSPFRTADDVMRQMVRDWHGAEREFKGNPATEYGTYHESGALVEYRMETGHDVKSVGFIEHEEWAGCSPDGLVGTDGGVEIKCPFSRRKMKEGDEFKPLSEQPHYHDQVQFSLWVTGRKWWDFVQWAPGGWTKIETVYPCEKWQDENLPKLRAFHDRYLVERQQDNAQPYLAEKLPEIDTLEAARLVEEYDDLTDAIEHATARKKEVLDAIVQLAGNGEARVSGRRLSLVNRAGTVAYAKALAKYAPDADLEPFRGNPSSHWRLT